MILIPLSVSILLIFPGVRAWVAEVFKLLGSVDPEPVKAYIRSFGPWAVAVSFVLMIIQSVAAPLPAFLITFSNAAVFGWIWGAVLSWSSSMAGAALCFGIARLYGRDVVVKLTGNSTLKAIDDFFAKFGGKSIVIARLLPFVPFDPVSYAAGLTSMRFLPFFLATGLGQLPATIVYSYAGGMLGGGAKTFVYGLFVVFALVALSVLLRSIFGERFLKKNVPVTESSRDTKGGE